MRRFVVPIVLVSLAAVAACAGSDAPSPGGDVIAVKLTPDNPVIIDGATITFAAVAISETGESKDISDSPSTTWESSDEGVLTVNADGTAEANSPGTSYVTARVAGITSPAQNVTVNAAPTTPPPTPTPTPPPAATTLVISELMYNPTAEPGGQYVEVFNPTASNQDMTGWTVNYNNGGGTAYTFGAFTLNAGAYVVLANDPTLFNGTTYPTVTNIFMYTMPDLLNGGGWFVLKNATPTTVDELAYGTGFTSTKPVGWCAAGSNLPNAGNGFPASRKPTNLDGDTCNDFVTTAVPNPGTATP